MKRRSSVAGNSNSTLVADEQASTGLEETAPSAVTCEKPMRLKVNGVGELEKDGIALKLAEFQILEHAETAIPDFVVKSWSWRTSTVMDLSQEVRRRPMSRGTIP